MFGNDESDRGHTPSLSIVTGKLTVGLRVCTGGSTALRGCSMMLANLHLPAWLRNAGRIMLKSTS